MFLSGWLTNELALFHIGMSALLLAGFAAFSTALSQPAGRLAVVLVDASSVGLVVVQWRAHPSREVL